MYSSFNVAGKKSRHLYRDWGVGTFGLPVLAAVVAITVAIKHPGVSKWISDASQAEFVNSNQLLQLVPAQLPQEAAALWTVKAD